MKTSIDPISLCLSYLDAEMKEIKVTSPSFYQAYEDADLDAVHPDNALWEQLLDSAPNDFARGLLIGRALLSVANSSKNVLN